MNSHMDDIAIWQAAAYELKLHGDKATGFAARHAERLSHLGDTERSRSWIKILRAIEALRSDTGEFQ